MVSRYRPTWPLCGPSQLRDDTDLLDAYEMTLFEGADDDILEGFRVEDGVERPLQPPTNGWLIRFAGSPMSSTAR